MFLLQGHLYEENEAIYRQLTSNNNSATATKMSVEKRVRAALNFIALIPSRKIRQMLANFPGVEV